MFTCFIRYKIEPNQLDEFRAYAHGFRWLENMAELTTAILFREQPKIICQVRTSVSRSRGRGAAGCSVMRIRTAIGADYLVRVGKQPDLSERRTAAVLWPRSLRGLAPD